MAVKIPPFKKKIEMFGFTEQTDISCCVLKIAFDVTYDMMEGDRCDDCCLSVGKIHQKLPS